jgi:predicted O-methyltransferase YrrM
MMDDQNSLKPPEVLQRIKVDTAALGFQMASEPLTGALLRTLAATKPAGRFLELGTGTGVSTAWLLDGMDEASHLISVENDADCIAVAKQYLGNDHRVSFHTEDAAVLLATLPKQQFDFIFADTWAGKYTHLEDTLQLLKPGGLYVIDDMLPQSSGPEGHAAKVLKLIAALENNAALVLTKMKWSSGIIIAACVESHSKL